MEIRKSLAHIEWDDNMKNMATISKVIRLSQNLRGAEHPMLTLCIGFVGRTFQKKYCQIHHAILFVLNNT